MWWHRENHEKMGRGAYKTILGPYTCREYRPSKKSLLNVCKIFKVDSAFIEEASEALAEAGQLYKKKRKQKGISRVDVTKYLESGSRTTVENIENGKYFPLYSDIKGMCEAVNVPVNFLTELIEFVKVPENIVTDDPSDVKDISEFSHYIANVIIHLIDDVGNVKKALDNLDSINKKRHFIKMLSGNLYYKPSTLKQFYIELNGNIEYFEREENNMRKNMAKLNEIRQNKRDSKVSLIDSFDMDIEDIDMLFSGNVWPLYKDLENISSIVNIPIDELEEMFGYSMIEDDVIEEVKEYIKNIHNKSNKTTPTKIKKIPQTEQKTIVNKKDDVDLESFKKGYNQADKLYSKSFASIINTIMKYLNNRLNKFEDILEDVRGNTGNGKKTKEIEKLVKENAMLKQRIEQLEFEKNEEAKIISSFAENIDEEVSKHLDIANWE